MNSNSEYAMKHDALIQLSFWGYLMYCEIAGESLF